MNAIVIQEDKRLRWQAAPEPVCSEGEALVEVHYSALNRADLMQAAGKYPAPAGASEILGLECSGVIARLPEGYAGGWQEGAQVCALLTGGGYAEYACVPTELLMPLPAGWTLEQAAALPEVFYTAFLNLFLEADLKEGEIVLIHGGASGVGTAAIQLSREAGARVFATAGRADKVALCLELGAELAVNYQEQDFAAAIREHAGGVDVILDMVGAEYFGRNLELLETGGRLVFISALSGSETTLDIRKLMIKRATLKGSTLRARPVADKLRIKEAFMTRFWDRLESGALRPIIDRVYPIAEAEVAHRQMRENDTVGKLLLKVK